jgi:hypothetical protein
MRFFFYGTLLDAELRVLLLGHASASRRLLPASLPGYVRRRSLQGCHPVVVRRRGGRVRGGLFDLDRKEALTVAFFEGPGFVPARRGVLLEDGARVDAWLFLPATPRAAGRQAWDLSRWQAIRKGRLIPVVRRWRGEYGARTLKSPEISWRVRRMLARS